MTRRLLLLTLVGALPGCFFGTSGRDVYQAEGLTLWIETLDGPTRATLVGELLAVEADAYVLDAFQTQGGTRTVVRVPLSQIDSGRIYARSASSGTDTDPLAGYGRVGTLRRFGQPKGRMPLQRLSRFPYGLEGDVLAALLARRGQSEILPYTEAHRQP